MAKKNVSDGVAITIEKNRLVVPNNPIIPFIRGDGTGRISGTLPFGYSMPPLAWLIKTKNASHGKKSLRVNVPFKDCGEWLPKETLNAIKKYKVAIKGPLTTPVGGGIRSLNVTLRQELDLYACAAGAVL